jgi:hypothetical protein
MKPVFQTRYDPPNGNCMAACVASILELPLDDVDIDVSAIRQVSELVQKLEAKAKCRIYPILPELITSGVVKSSEPYCILEVCSSICNGQKMWHALVCRIADNGELSLAFNPLELDQRKHLSSFNGIKNAYIVRR